MRTGKIRQRLQQLGFTLLQHGQGFMVTDGGVKNSFEKQFNNLEEVEAWIVSKAVKNNRLNEEESAEWDKMFEEFCYEK